MAISCKFESRLLYPLPSNQSLCRPSKAIDEIVIEKQKIIQILDITNNIFLRIKIIYKDSES